MVPPKESILMGFSILNHPFWGTPTNGNLHILGYYNSLVDVIPRLSFLYHLFMGDKGHTGIAVFFWGSGCGSLYCEIV